MGRRRVSNVQARVLAACAGGVVAVGAVVGVVAMADDPPERVLVAAAPTDAPPGYEDGTTGTGVVDEADGTDPDGTHPDETTEDGTGAAREARGYHGGDDVDLDDVEPPLPDETGLAVGPELDLTGDMDGCPDRDTAAADLQAATDRDEAAYIALIEAQYGFSGPVESPEVVALREAEWDAARGETDLRYRDWERCFPGEAPPID